MKRTVTIVAVLGLVLLTSGCMTRVFNEGTGAVLGAKSNIVEITPLYSTQPLGPVTVDKVENAMGRPVTSDWLLTLGADLRQKTMSEKDLVAGRRPVKIAGKVVHLEGPGFLDKALSPTPEVVVQITVTDVATGQVLAVANAVGRGRGGETSASQDKLCSALSTGVTKWLRKAGRHGDD
ncbi:MAG: hypothetical protein PHU85_07415 [Phycisphaerae bacterium]|nr:hypothetical protein [Phycisphaerae bacterium]